MYRVLAIFILFSQSLRLQAEESGTADLSSTATPAWSRENLVEGDKSKVRIFIDAMMFEGQKRSSSTTVPVLPGAEAGSDSK